ncbi:MAG TPA: SCO6880 family protein [Propionicimonas sp.]|jgi:hypothetical protein
MSEPQVRATTFARLEHRGVILGLSGVQLAVVGVAAGIAVAAVYSGGSTGLLVSAPVWGVLLAAGTVSVAGRPVVRWLPLLASWQVRRFLGVTTKATTTRDPVPNARLVVHGLAGQFDLIDGATLGGVLVVDRRSGNVTGILSVSGPGYVLADVATQEHRVDAWGRVLASVCHQPAIVRVQLLGRAVPSGLGAARRWWRDHTVDGGGSMAETLAGLLDEGFVTPIRRETLLAFAVRLPRGVRRGTGLADVETQLQAIAASLPGADLTAGGWLDRAHLTRALRSGCEPFVAARTEEVPLRSGTTAGIQERWASVTVGTATHATYWVSEWPRTATHPGFLQPLLLGGTDVRAFSLIAEPLSTTRALREIRRAKVEYASDAAQRHRLGQVEDEATRAEVADLERREAELVAGHGDLRFTGLLTVSAATEAELEDRCLALETAAAQAMCEVRRLVGQQGVSFLAAALPLARGVL